REFSPEVLILTQIQYGRGLAVEQLEKAARETFLHREKECGTKHLLPGKLLVIPTVREALREALREKKERDTVFCAGSLYLVGEIKEAVKEEENGE
ncbi:MAG: bifunctional folylpolyglutamate synthase/dihydrofolate synthase, partial [Otoolea sp.]